MILHLFVVKNVRSCCCCRVWGSTGAHNTSPASSGGGDDILCSVSPREQRRAGSNATRRDAYRFSYCFQGGGCNGDSTSCSLGTRYCCYPPRDRCCCQRPRELFCAPCSKSPRFPCRTAVVRHRRIKISLRPSRHHRPSQTPTLLGYLFIKNKKQE